jgi:hypothetical protein
VCNRKYYRGRPHMMWAISLKNIRKLTIWS